MPSTLHQCTLYQCFQITIRYDLCDWDGSFGQTLTWNCCITPWFLPEWWSCGTHLCEWLYWRGSGFHAHKSECTCRSFIGNPHTSGKALIYSHFGNFGFHWCDSLDFLMTQQCSRKDFSALCYWYRLSFCASHVKCRIRCRLLQLVTAESGLHHYVYRTVTYQISLFMLSKLVLLSRISAASIRTINHDHHNRPVRRVNYIVNISAIKYLHYTVPGAFFTSRWRAFFLGFFRYCPLKKSYLSKSIRSFGSCILSAYVHSTVIVSTQTNAKG